MPMITLSRLALAVLTGGPVVGVVVTGVPAPKPEPSAGRIVGEWSYAASIKQPNDTEVVWTFRDNGTVRIDGVDRANGEEVRGPMVGRWRLEGRDLLVTWETWNERDNHPVQVEERLRIRELTDGALAVQVIYAPPRDPPEGHTLEFKRFGGWDRRR